MRGYRGAIGVVALSLSGIADTIALNGNGFTYDYMDDGIRILRVAKGRLCSEPLIFPDKINDVDVVDIGTNACDDVWGPTGNSIKLPVQLPSKLKRLHARAFNRFSFAYPQTLRFPKTLEYIDKTFAATPGGTYNDAVTMMSTSIFDGPPPEISDEAPLSWDSRYGSAGPLANKRNESKVYVNDLYYDMFLNASVLLRFAMATIASP